MQIQMVSEQKFKEITVFLKRDMQLHDFYKITISLHNNLLAGRPSLRSALEAALFF